MIYWALLRFFLPLMLTQVVLGMGSQFLSGGMARMPQAAHTLAVFGLAWGLTDFLVSPIWQARQLGLVLARDRATLRQLRRFVLVCCSGLALALFALSSTGLGDWVIGDLHGVEEHLAFQVRWVLLAFVPLPFMVGLNRLYSGILIQYRRTDIVSGAMLAGMAVQIACVLVLLRVDWVVQRPILLPLMAVYLGEITGVSIVLWGYAASVKTLLVGEGDRGFDWRYVAHFFWPLALVMAIQGLSRPLINLFVSRQSDGVIALAVLAVVYPLAHLPYGWLNELRSVPAAFRNEDADEAIVRFALGCGAFSFLAMVLLFWTPLRDVVLLEWVAVDVQLAQLSALPLFLFSFFPLAVCLRSYLNGIALVQHRTRALAPSAPARIAAIGGALALFSPLGWSGATLGVSALLCGFFVEALSVWLGVRGWPSVAHAKNGKETTGG